MDEFDVFVVFLLWQLYDRFRRKRIAATRRRKLLQQREERRRLIAFLSSVSDASVRAATVRRLFRR